MEGGSAGEGTSHGRQSCQGSLNRISERKKLPSRSRPKQTCFAYRDTALSTRL
jgi:hypothetical protein